MTWLTLDRAVTWIVLPLAALGVVGEVLAGDLAHAILPAVWGIMIYLSHRELRGWRNRTNEWTRREKDDRNRFAIEVLLMKSKAADAMARRYRGHLDEPEVREALCGLYRHVAETWIPDSAGSEWHDLKRAALHAAETGEAPPPHLRLIH